MSIDLVARLIDAGTPPALVAEVAMALGRAERLLDAEMDREIAAERRRQHVRQLAADRQRRHRQEAASRLSRVTRVTERDMRDADPSPNKNPPDPHKLTPTPREGGARAREAEPVPVHHRLAAAQLAIAVVIGGLGRRRWRAMPPPAGVTGEQWQGFLDHRRSLRNALTPRAYTLLCARLERLAEDGWPPGAMVDLAVERGWRSVFSPRPGKHDQRSHQDGPAPRGGGSAEDIFAARRRLGVDG